MAKLENTIMTYERRDIDIGHGVHTKDIDIKHHRRNVDIYSITDYTSIDISNILSYVKNSDQTMFDWYQIEDNDKIERISLELYGNINYWDILMIINQRNPLFEMPFDFDTLSNLALDQVEEFIDEVYKKPLGELEHAKMYSKWETKYIANNEIFRIIKIIRPTRMSEFLQNGYDQGVF